MASTERSTAMESRPVLAALLVSLYQGGRLHVAEDLAHAATLTREMATFRVKIDLRTGHDSYEAWRKHDHDDLVLAVALACWYAARPTIDHTPAVGAPNPRLAYLHSVRPTLLRP